MKLETTVLLSILIVFTACSTVYNVNSPSKNEFPNLKEGQIYRVKTRSKFSTRESWTKGKFVEVKSDQLYLSYGRGRINSRREIDEIVKITTGLSNGAVIAFATLGVIGAIFGLALLKFAIWGFG